MPNTVPYSIPSFSSTPKYNLLSPLNVTDTSLWNYLKDTNFVLSEELRDENNNLKKQIAIIKEERSAAILRSIETWLATIRITRQGNEVSWLPS